MNSLTFRFVTAPPASSHLPAWSFDAVQTHGANAHGIVFDADDSEVARASLWWSRVPSFPDEQLGVIGHFATTSEAATQILLDECCERLRAEGCTLAVGPMDGNTWRKYRLVTEPGTEPPFFMEIANPPEWPGFLAASGFTPLATYTSSLNDNLTHRDPRTDRAAQRLLANGVTIRSIDVNQFEADLRKIYEVSAISFVHNFLYTELSETDFLAQYLPIQSKVQPELVLLAEHAGRPVGYLFAIPDLAQAARGQKIDTVIGKTLAVLPGKTYGGLGVVLTDRLQQTAHQLGYTRVIHALQHEQNHVRNMSEFYGPVMRRYVLFSKPLR